MNTIKAMLQQQLDVLLDNTLSVEVIQDDEPYSPRENCNAGILCVSHKHLRNETDDFESDNHSNWDEVEQWLRAEKGAIEVVPVYLYSHGMVRVNTTGFQCRWDSGQAGLYYTTVASYQNAVSNELDADKIRQCLVDEISDLDKWVSGEIYAYKVINKLGKTLSYAGNYYDYKDALAEGNHELESLQVIYNKELQELKREIASQQELDLHISDVA